MTGKNSNNANKLNLLVPLLDNFPVGKYYLIKVIFINWEY